MDALWNDLTSGLPESGRLLQFVVRLLTSAMIAALIGLQREKAGKDAGLRTHILVAAGSTVFVLGAIGSGMGEDALSRVIQGVVTGVGFIGAGTILKRESRSDIKGLTTSSGLWTVCAIGVLVGLGHVGIALITALVTLSVLILVGRLQKRFLHSDDAD